MNLERQSSAFSCGEGDAWHSRNEYAKLNPIVVRELLSIKSGPKTIVEIGCGDGRYLNEMQKHYACNCVGYDPSIEAVVSGTETYPNLYLRQENHGVLEFIPHTDVIVFGFCLYLVDRQDLFQIVANADKALRDGGHIIIHDFEPKLPHRVPYHHKDGIWTYKMDYPALWLANPAYRYVSEAETRDGECITIIKKDYSSWQG